MLSIYIFSFFFKFLTFFTNMIVLCFLVFYLDFDIVYKWFCLMLGLDDIMIDFVLSRFLPEVFVKFVDFL
jgi:hypothetical protein